MKTKAIQVRLPEEMKEKFDQICKANSINTSALMRSWIERFIKEEEKKQR